MFPEIPVEFLQEKEVFKEFIYRINTLGRCHFCKSGTVTHVSLRQTPRPGSGLFSSFSLKNSGRDLLTRMHLAVCSELSQWEIRS